MANKYETKIKKMLKNDDFDVSEIDEYIEEHEEEYNEGEKEYELSEFAFRAAVEIGNHEYVEEHIDDFDLNDNGDSSSYLNLTKNEEMIELLMDHGAFRSWEDYSDCKFAVETINCTILAFDSDFQKEIFEKYKEENDISDESVVKILEEEIEDEEIANVLELLGVILDGGEIAFVDQVDSPGNELKDLLEELGWECDFEGEMWKLETSGVYFIK